LLARQPGARESRYAHLLSGPVESIQIPATGPPTSPVATTASEQEDRIAQLEATVTELKSDLDNLKKRLDDLLG
jgi:hypothetical protein